jgi:hypothetical protein
MDYRRVVEELRGYLADVDAAILSIRRLENTSARRGPPVARDAAKRSARRRKVRSVSQAQTRGAG